MMKRKKKISSIRVRIFLFIGALILLSIMFLATIVDRTAKRTITDSLKRRLTDATANAANLFDSHIREWWEYASGLALSDTLQDPDISYLKKAQRLEGFTKAQDGNIKHWIVDAQGRLYLANGDVVDVSKDDWFIESKGGKNEYFSTPFISKINKELISVICVPVFDINGNFFGAFQLQIDGRFLSMDSLPDFNLEGKTSQIFILDKNGTHIANKDLTFVTKRVNRIEEAKSDPSLKSLATAMSKAISEESGLINFKYNGIDRVGGFAKMKQTGWTVVITQDVKELEAPLYSLRIKLLFINIAVLIAAFCVIFFIVQSITKPLNRTVDALKNIAEGEGDLTVRLPVQGNDELTQMAAYFNKTMEKIRAMTKKVGVNAVAMHELGTNLSSNMTETASAVNQISSNIEGVKQQVINQSASVTETSATMEEIIRTIEQLNASIESQATSVTQSSASIEEMVANIASITESLNENNQAMGDLAEQIMAGRNGAVDANNFVKQMSERSDALGEAANVIQNIASQTNLLAMNATIEAAHAGDSGKGFAVVADEIRKLAEESNNQGKQIGAMIKETIAIIVEMTKAGKATEEIFNRVYQVSSKIAEREEVVAAAMQEQDRGNKEVLQTIKTISEVTSEVKGGSTEMLSGGRTIAKEMQKLDELTRMITDSMNEMASGVVQINNAVQEVQEMAHQNKNAIDSLNNEVGKFKV